MIGPNRPGGPNSVSSTVYYRDRYWNEHPLVVEQLNRRATGAAHPGWMDHLLRHHGGRPYRRALILNCGNGWVERDLLRLGVIEAAVGIDLLPDLLDDARARAAAEGLALEYRCTDINADPLDDDYDLVVNHAAGHHIARIDQVFRRIAAHLPADGAFVSWDYVGPHRNQYTAAQWEIAHELNQTLPTDLRAELIYPSMAAMLADDPSEAVHSELILPVMRRYFTLVHEHALGGVPGYLLLTHNPRLLDGGDDPRVDDAVRRILSVDELLVEQDPSSTLFAYVIAHPKARVLDDSETLAAWAAEEEQRERRAEADGGRYYPPTMIADLLAAPVGGRRGDRVTRLRRRLAQVRQRR